MNALRRLSALVASLGTDIQFVAFWAHFGVAYIVVSYLPSWWTAGAIALVAGVKEFVFDARQEKPKQTFLDNLEDWIGYVLGALFCLRHFWPHP